LTSNIVFRSESESPRGWSPVVGEFTEIFLKDLFLDEESKNRLLNESAQILGNCTPPKTKEYQESGLVLGFVQSGKTLSFTTIAALARDNGYGLVIVLAGVTNLLRNQSLDRLIEDLGLERYREWRVFDNPGASTLSHLSSDLIDFNDRLEQWKTWQAGGKIKKPSLLVTVLKHPGRLNNLARLLGAVDLRSVPVLIIDDESDQASPNTKSASNLRKGLDESSSTYEAIDNLRSRVPRHSYLQYTATPQANLLAAKSDALSPAFSRVISAGHDYVGGDDFFSQDMKNVVEIPIEDEVTVNSIPIEPPKSLQDSLLSFWVASAIALAEDHRGVDGRPSTRSMMIQTSARTQPHAQFAAWVRSIRALWKNAIKDEESASHADLIHDFEQSFNELMSTYDSACTFEDIREWILEAIEETKVVEINSTDEAVKVIKWSESQFWILIGGMKLDRGFTVKGITHTYMPRSVAENAATLQQRARFFGYHRKYLGLCRIYIGRSTLDAFVAYVAHEKALRLSLEKCQGKSLKEWKRTFIMDAALGKPVRSNVIGMHVQKSSLTHGWVAPRFMHENTDAVSGNLNTFRALVKKLREDYAPSPLPVELVDRRAGTGHVFFESIPIQILQNLLLDLQITNPWDANIMMPLAVSVSRLAEREPEAEFDLFLINSLETAHLEGRNATGKGIENLFVGRSPKTVDLPSDLIYVGDRDVHTTRLTVHLRFVLVKGVEDNNGQMTPVPWIAVLPTPDMTLQLLEEWV
jgi:hypothetical protein